MSPLGGSLLLLLVAVALVGVGYVLGRTWPAPRPKRAGLRSDKRSDQRSDKRSDTRPAAGDTRPGERPARADRPVRTAQAATSLNSGDRLQREIEERVKTLRRAREHAEPWRPPAVDAIEAPDVEELPAHRVWFADTAVEPYAQGSQDTPGHRGNQGNQGNQGHQGTAR